jgi:alpha-1,3-rhamnosyl/mannosyltransferase
MHIGIDGGCWGNRRGFGRFLRELLHALARTGGENAYTVFLDRAASANFDLGVPFRARVVETSQAVSEAANAQGRRSVPDLLRMGRAVARERLDLFFFPSVYSYFPLLRRVPTVLGIHDTIADRNPRFAFATRRQELFWNWKVRLALAQADTVLTVSRYSQSCLESLFRIPPSRIRVLYEAAAPGFRRSESPPDRGRYILYVGGISPNKNLATLIRAFSTLMARKTGVRLVLVGDYTSDGFKGCHSELVELVRELGLHREVEFAGYVPDDELRGLYSGAALFAMPSFDEGFGLPALEAMACGVPVVVSSGNALEEVVGDAGVCVDPRDTASLAAAMDRLLADPEAAREMAARSLRRAAQFSWEKAARELLAVFRDTVALKTRNTVS